MSSFTAVAIANFGDADDFAQWLLFHQLEMQQLRSAVGGNAALFPLQTLDLTDAQETRAWLDAHYIEHENIQFAIDGGNVVNIRDVDFSDAFEWDTWMQAHAVLHFQQLTALGLA